MFARHVSFHLKPNSVTEVTQTLEKEILPLLRKESRFQDEINLLAPVGREAVGISLWDQKESAEAYERGAHAEVLQTMGNVIEGTLQVKTYEVSLHFNHSQDDRRRHRLISPEEVPVMDVVLELFRSSLSFFQKYSDFRACAFIEHPNSEEAGLQQPSGFSSGDSGGARRMKGEAGLILARAIAAADSRYGCPFDDEKLLNTRTVIADHSPHAYKLPEVLMNDFER